jgi:hypothetical protein
VLYVENSGSAQYVRNRHIESSEYSFILWGHFDELRCCLVLGHIQETVAQTKFVKEILFS